MQSYDVQYLDLYRIKSQRGVVYNVELLPGEGVAGLGGVRVIPTGRRVIITSEEQTVRPLGYRIDYDADGNVMYPVTPAEIGKMIRELTEIGCCEYTPDLLRAIQQRKTELMPFEVDNRLRL